MRYKIQYYSEKRNTKETINTINHIAFMMFLFGRQRGNSENTFSIILRSTGITPH